MFVADQNTDHPVARSGLPASDVAIQLADERGISRILPAYDQDQILGVRPLPCSRLAGGTPSGWAGKPPDRYRAAPAA